MKKLKSINWRKYLGNERGAISLGGAAAPAATPVVANPNFRQFNMTCLDADTGPTAFNHGVQCDAVSNLIAWIIPQVLPAIVSNMFLTWTATQVTITKFNVVGSGGGVPGTTVIASVIVWQPTTGIR
jgi:hypothetical protein